MAAAEPRVSTVSQGAPQTKPQTPASSHACLARVPHAHPASPPPCQAHPAPLRLSLCQQAKQAIVRHLLLAACAAAPLFISIGFLVLSLLTPPFEWWVLTLFTASYVFTIAVVIIPVCVLGFCVRDNFERAVNKMSMDESQMRRLMLRLLAAPFA